MIRTKVVHCKREPYDVYIGRPGPWGNPFTEKQDTRFGQVRVGSVQEAIDCFEMWIQEDRQFHLLCRLHELYNKTLGCWCKIKGSEPCHGDILIKLIEKYVRPCIKCGMIFSWVGPPVPLCDECVAKEHEEHDAADLGYDV